MLWTRRSLLGLLTLCLAGVFALAAPVAAEGGQCSCPCPCQQAAQPLRATVLFFNDLHGALQPFKVKDESGQSIEVGGIARIAAMIRKIRAENEQAGAETVVLVAGDILQGTPMSTVFTGKPDIEVLNLIGVDAMTIGNHEFDFGLENFLALKRMARFPFLSSNIVWKDTGEALAAPTWSLKLCGRIHLTVIGATTRELLITTKPSNVEKIDVLDSTQTVGQQLQRLRTRGPVILLSHSRFQTDSEIARAAPQLTAIIGGHDQILFNPHRVVGGVPVFQAFEKGRHLGRIDLDIEQSTGRARIANWTYLPVNADVPVDPEAAALVDRYAAQLDDKFKEVIGENRRFLYGERDKIRFEETNLGDFVADVMREFTRADVALINAGALRSSIDEGPVTLEEVFKTMPYANDLQIVELEGAALRQVLERAVRSDRDEEDGGFLHVSGLRFEISEKRPRSVSVGGAALDPARTYRVAVTDFMSSGGDGYDVLKGKPTTSTGLPLRELLVDVIRTRKTINVGTDGRITRH